MTVVEQIYKLRRDFLLIGLTGRTGSGCSTVAKILGSDINDIKTEYREINDGPWDNDSRKNRIVYKYMKEHWHKFKTIKASDVIFYYAFLLEFDDFVKEFSLPTNTSSDKLNNPDKTGVEIQPDQKIVDAINPLKSDFEQIRSIVLKCEEYINKDYIDPQNKDIPQFQKLLFDDIPMFRKKLEKQLVATVRRIIAAVLQKWGDNIRLYDSILPSDAGEVSEKAPACLARKINRFIKMLRAYDRNKHDEKLCTHIVIDALRNPYEVLYFRERYSAFYLMSINTDKQTRINKLVEQGYNITEINNLDNREEGKSDVANAYQAINILKCIELSDIHVTHNGEPYENNRFLNNQIITYLALMRHPGLVPPSPIERVMQIAYTAKLNSGCLSRQVGAAVTNSDFSVLSIGWNTVAQGQTPCSLRSLLDLKAKEDSNAFSDYEKDKPFMEHVNNLWEKYDKCSCNLNKMGLPMAYCFKDIHTTITPKQRYNQVHTRSLHAEENAFLQLVKYGNSGVEGGKLFTTSSCCELCGKKAYQLGIKEIYYIDNYPGITYSHIISSGENRPQMIQFHGAIGRAYISLFNPFLPLKDEIETLTGIDVKTECENYGLSKEAKEKKS